MVSIWNALLDWNGLNSSINQHFSQIFAKGNFATPAEVGKAGKLFSGHGVERLENNGLFKGIGEKEHQEVCFPMFFVIYLLVKLIE